MVPLIYVQLELITDLSTCRNFRGNCGGLYSHVRLYSMIESRALRLIVLFTLPIFHRYNECAAHAHSPVWCQIGLAEKTVPASGGVGREREHHFSPRMQRC